MEFTSFVFPGKRTRKTLSVNELSQSINDNHAGKQKNLLAHILFEHLVEVYKSRASDHKVKFLMGIGCECLQHVTDGSSHSVR